MNAVIQTTFKRSNKMTIIHTVSIDYQQNDETNRGILTIRFTPTTHITFNIDLDDLNKSTILDYDNLNIPPSEESYYIAMSYQIMSSNVFQYFHYNK